MFGSFEGDLLKLFTEINPNEIMVLKKNKVENNKIALPPP